MRTCEVVVWKKGNRHSYGKRHSYGCETIKGCKDLFEEFCENYRLENQDMYLADFNKYFPFGILTSSRDGYITVYAGRV